MEKSYDYFEMDKNEFTNDNIRIAIEDTINSLHAFDLLKYQKEIYDIISKEEIIINDGKVNNINLHRIARNTYGKELTFILLNDTINDLNNNYEETIKKINLLKSLYNYFANIMKSNVPYDEDYHLFFANYVIKLYYNLINGYNSEKAYKLSLYASNLESIPFLNNYLINHKSEVINFIESLSGKEAI